MESEIHETRSDLCILLITISRIWKIRRYLDRIATLLLNERFFTVVST
jgi:hypothetical protein